MHLSNILSVLGLASLAVAGPVQVAERQTTQKLRISKWTRSAFAKRVPLLTPTSAPR